MSTDKRELFYIQVHGSRRERKHAVISTQHTVCGPMMVLVLYRTFAPCSCFRQFPFARLLPTRMMACGGRWRHSTNSACSAHTRKTRFEDGSKKEREWGDTTDHCTKELHTMPTLSQSSVNSGCMRNDIFGSKQSVSVSSLFIFNFLIFQSRVHSQPSQFVD